MKIMDLPPLERERLSLSAMKATPFRYSNKSYDESVDWLCGFVGERSRHAAEWWYTNYGKAMKNGFRALRISLRASYWTGNKAKIGYKQVKRVIDWLEENEYIIKYSGGTKDTESYQTIVVFTDKLHETVDLNNILLYVPKGILDSPVVLKDRELKEYLPLPDTLLVRNMIQDMNRYNGSVAGVDIAFNGEPVPLTEYKRSFSGDLTKGGRLYVHGGGIQLLKGDYRSKYLTIDGSPVVEIDYKANHAMLLYEAIALGDPSLYALADSDFDPYLADSSFIYKDRKLVSAHMKKWDIDKYDPIRNLYKQVFMSMLNCDSYQKARQSVNYAIHLDYKKPKHKRKFVGIDNIDAGKVLDSMGEHNHRVEDYFYRDYGVVLQKLDSDIAMRVIDRMIQSGNTCLCYHDSFIAKKEVDTVLEDAMIQGWKDIVKENKFCKVEVR